MTLNYTHIFDETLKSKFKQLAQSGHATDGVALAALKEQLARGDESELDWVVSNLRRLEEQVRSPQEENELLYGKLTNRKNM